MLSVQVPVALDVGRGVGHGTADEAGLVHYDGEAVDRGVEGQDLEREREREREKREKKREKDESKTTRKGEETREKEEEKEEEGPRKETET